MRRFVAVILTLVTASVVASASLLASPMPVKAACAYGSNQTRTKSITAIPGYKITSTVVYRIFSCNGIPADVYVVSETITDQITGFPNNPDGQFLDQMQFWSNMPYFPYNGRPDQIYWPVPAQFLSDSCQPHSPTLGTCFTRTKSVGKSASYSTALVAEYDGSMFGFAGGVKIFHAFIPNTIDCAYAGMEHGGHCWE